MVTVKTTDELQEAIIRLEQQRKDELLMLKNQVQETFEELRPTRLLKNVLHDVVARPGAGQGLVDTSLGLMAGHLSEKFVVGNTGNPIKKVLGSILKYAVTNMVTRHPGAIKAVGMGIFRGIAALTQMRSKSPNS